jgi:hypothetical protein
MAIVDPDTRETPGDEAASLGESTKRLYGPLQRFADMTQDPPAVRRILVQLHHPHSAVRSFLLPPFVRAASLAVNEFRWHCHGK